jgi:hypothetical protein
LVAIHQPIGQGAGQMGAVGLGHYTAAVCNDSSLPDLFHSDFLNQADNSMVCASGFEGADFLVILAFEIQVDFGVGAASATRGGGDLVESVAC